MDIPTYVSGAVFMKAYRVLRIQVADCLQKYGLTPASWVFLGEVASSKKGTRVSEVASELVVKTPLVTNMAHQFIDRELIRRVADPLDSRAKLLAATPKGRRFVEQVEADMKVTLGHLLSGVSRADQAAYKKVLETIIKNSGARTS